LHGASLDGTIADVKASRSRELAEFARNNGYRRAELITDIG
jgi:hypothetical protein